MTAQQLAQLLSQSAKGITYDRLQKLKGAVLRENRLGNPITFEQVVEHLSPADQQVVAKVLVGKKG